jgi:uncharacterized membrane protein YvbJ
MARPRKRINPEQVRSLAMINCSYAEIAAVIGCNESTLTRRFAQLIAEGREQGRSSLKRQMYKKAIDDENVQMQIWLSKNMVGYSDKVEQKVKSEGTLAASVNTMSREEFVEQKKKFDGEF